MSEKTEAYLARKKENSPDNVAEHFQTLENFYVNKLWNQVAEQTHLLVYDNQFTSVVDLKEFYDHFIHEFQHRINVLKLVEIIIPVANHLFNSVGKDEAYAFLATLEKTVSKSDEAAVRMRTAQIALHLRDKRIDESCKDVESIRKMIEETREQLDKIPGVTSVHAPFFKVSSHYQKEVGNHAGYYREALRYLGCEDLDGLSETEKKDQAVALAHAAMLGSDIYNFGELLAHPILKSLKGAGNEYLLELLYAFNSGDLEKFRKYEKRWITLPNFKESKELLEGKIRLLCLMEMAMTRPPKRRYLSFDEVASRAQLPADKVEFLVMKALSNNLIQGSIDQVERSVRVTWVQPRVLSLEQIGNLAERINLWRRDVESMEGLLKSEAKDIIVES